MNDNELQFYRNPFAYILYGIIIGFMLSDIHINLIKTTIKFHRIWLGALELLLIIFLALIIRQLFKAIRNEPVITLTEDGIIEHKIGLVLKWTDIIEISKEGYKNNYIKIQLRQPYSNFQTIHNLWNRLYYKINYRFNIRSIDMYLTYIKGNDDEIVNQINDYKNNLTIPSN